jgi:uncharacterized damage-inducible protein DinB
MQRTPWVERKFQLDLPPGWIYNVLERLHGTVPRLQHMLRDFEEEKTTIKPGGAWSIREHIGHLHDLEELQFQRIDDFVNRRSVLRAADMQNIKTYEAGYNERPSGELIKKLDATRALLISKFAALDDETQSFQSLHPRLQVMMRPVDLVYFTAEHDDHHLATIRELIRH